MSKNLNESQSISTITFLSDAPLNADRTQEMRFGHQSIVENLKNMIVTCPTPFTIGLFGKWGTGKTTIADAIIRGFEATETAAIKIDAWKHEGDALRRTFLEDAVKQLKEKQGRRPYLDNNFKLNKNVSRAVSRTSKLNNLKWWYFLPVLGLLVMIGLLIAKFRSNDLGTYVTSVTGTGLISGVLLWVLQQSVTQDTETAMDDRFKDPQQFELEFKKVVDSVTADKILIVIDNLDRVTCEKAVELLSTIKTFLEVKKCVFLIACDASAIRKHLEREYEFSIDKNDRTAGIDGDEFLRKFFNIFIVIPEFIDTELQDYTEALLKETGFIGEGMSDVAYVVSKAFRDNPRQIKQFINTFLGHFLLARIRERSQGFDKLPEGLVTGNTAYLAKDLVIRIKYPEYYESEQLITGKPNNDLNDFLRATQFIHFDGDNRAFRHLKLSEQETKIPEILDLENALQDNNIDVATTVIHSIISSGEENKRAVQSTVLSLISQNKNRRAILSNTVIAILSVARKLDLRFDKQFYVEIAELFRDDDRLGGQLDIFDLETIFTEVLSFCEEGQRINIIHKYSVLLYNGAQTVGGIIEPYKIQLLQEFINHTDWLDKSTKNNIRAALAETYCKVEVLEMFVGKNDTHKEFLTEKTMANFIKQISLTQGSREIEKEANLILAFKAILTDKNLSEIFTQLTALLSAESNNPWGDEKEKLLASIDDLINGLSKNLEKLDKNLINPFAVQYVNGINTAASWEHKRIFVHTCDWLSHIVDEPYKSQINSALNRFYTGAGSSELSFVLEKFKTKEGKRELVKKNVNTFKQRVLADQKIFDLLYPLGGDDVRTEFLTALIMTDHQRAVSKLEELKYQVDDRKAIVSAILTKASQLPNPQRETLYLTCNKMECANDVQLKDRFTSYIKIHLKDPTPDSQRIGLSVLQGASCLSQSQKRDIIIDTVEWLATLQPNSAYQPSSILSPLVLWDDLTPSLKQKFVDFVFDKLIRRGINIQNIDLGFGILGKVELKLEYNEYSQYFDDILNRIEKEPNPDIKSHLVKGLKSLEPEKKLNQSSSDFWKKVKLL